MVPCRSLIEETARHTHTTHGPIMLDSDPKPNILACARCLYDETVPGIHFDQDGICNYCHLHDQMEQEYPLGPVGEARLADLVATIRQVGRGKKYDCIIGVSGGCDSSFLVYRMVELGLRPLAVHFDNTWNSPTATQNIYNVLKGLNVDLYTHVVNNKEAEDIYRAFLLSGVSDIEAPTDIALAATMYRAAEKHGIRYIIEGHSFRTEGIAPLGWVYMDGKYISSIHKQFGTLPMKTFPNMPMHRFIKWISIDNIRRVRPLYHMQYNKEQAKVLLKDRFGWEWYGGHHLENRFTAFYHSYFIPRRFGLDLRVIAHSAMVRSGQLDRSEGAQQLAIPPEDVGEIVEIVKKRLGFSTVEFERIMDAPRKRYTDYPTYKKTFERLQPLFWLLYKSGRVPKSFYIKFTKPADADIST
jgi:N-acetyl sugar amidotransferase